MWSLLSSEAHIRAVWRPVFRTTTKPIVLYTFTLIKTESAKCRGPPQTRVLLCLGLK